MHSAAAGRNSAHQKARFPVMLWGVESAAMMLRGGGVLVMLVQELRAVSQAALAQAVSQSL
jgi:hypothetical protein